MYRCTLCIMAVLNIRELDEGLMRKLKADAAASGITLRAHVIELLSGSKAKPASEGETGRTGERGTEREIPSQVSGSCPRCGGQTIPWGAMRRCTKCARNW
jgi:plasmid stability protein